MMTNDNLPLFRSLLRMVLALGMPKPTNSLNQTTTSEDATSDLFTLTRNLIGRRRKPKKPSLNLFTRGKSCLMLVESGLTQVCPLGVDSRCPLLKSLTRDPLVSAAEVSPPLICSCWMHLQRHLRKLFVVGNNNPFPKINLFAHLIRHHATSLIRCLNDRWKLTFDGWSLDRHRALGQMMSQRRMINRVWTRRTASGKVSCLGGKRCWTQEDGFRHGLYRRRTTEDGLQTKAVRTRKKEKQICGDERTFCS